MYTTLYKVLKTERIEIPIIQRDYAQGRENKVFLRERLLGSLIQALKDNQVISLDFVYGTKEHGVMWPLDGQQRLTTLWLLHWYLAVRTNQLSDAGTWLCNFTYETRTTSRDFCKSLCSMDTYAFNESKMKIVDFIKDQTWYYSKYNQDPTIQGMLRTLGGTDLTNSEDVDITDGIEEFLFEDNQCLLYWERLINDNCPIQFLYKDMKDENLPLSDDLYIKMNSRGKQLTDFENFKADLIGFAPNPDNPNDKLLDVITASLIDNEWTDVFWREASRKRVYKVDDIYFKFLRRYFLDRLLASPLHNPDEVVKLPLYQDLYKGKSNYDGIKKYEEVLTKDTINNLKLFFSHWNSVLISPHWDNTYSFAVIPEYIVQKTDENGKPVSYEISAITQKERAIFHAVICYFESNESFDKSRFDEWMRFAWNIVENSGLENERNMIGAIRFFEELRPYSGSIIDFLSSNKALTSKYASRQMEEERFKAHLINGDSSSIWRKCLYEAENLGFFKGNIACLLRHEGKEYVDDIECFNIKLTNAKKYFDNNGVKAEFAKQLTQALMKTIARWDQIVGVNADLYIFDTSSEGWKRNLLNNEKPGYYNEIHKLLTIDNIEELPLVLLDEDLGEWTKSANKIKTLLAETDFLKQTNYYGEIVKNASQWRLKWAYGVLAFYPFGRNYAYNFDWIDPDWNYSFRRNELLHNPEIRVNSNNNPECDGIYWKWVVNFTFKEHLFSWNNHNDIFLLNESHQQKKRDSEHKNEKGDEYFVIHMNEYKGISADSFLSILSDLIDEGENTIKFQNDEIHIS